MFVKQHNKGLLVRYLCLNSPYGGLVFISITRLCGIDNTIWNIPMHSHNMLQNQQSTWMQDKSKVYMGSYMTSNESCFMDSSKKPPLGGSPNTKVGDHGTPNAHKHWFILFIMCEDAHEEKVYRRSIWSRARSNMTSHYTWGHVTTLHDFGGVFGRFWTLPFGLSQCHGRNSWLMCEVAQKLRPCRKFWSKLWECGNFLVHQCCSCEWRLWIMWLWLLGGFFSHLDGLVGIHVMICDCEFYELYGAVRCWDWQPRMGDGITLYA